MSKEKEKKAKEFDLKLQQYIEDTADYQNMAEDNKHFYISEKNKDIQETLRRREIISNGAKILEQDDTEKFNHQLRENQDLIKKSAPFLEIEELRDVFRTFPRQLGLILAPTGEGKTTLACTIAANKIKAGGRVLYLANEETSQDVMVRIICQLSDKISFKKYKEQALSDEELLELQEKQKLLGDRLKVVAAADGEAGEAFTTTPSGIDRIIRDAAQHENKPDLVLLDYFQNVLNGYEGKEPHQVNNILANTLDQLKNQVDFPIIVMSQIHKMRLTEKDANRSFQEVKAANQPQYRSLGGRTIFTKATDVVEIEKVFTEDPANAHSSMYVYKNRFGLNQNTLVLLKFDVKKMGYTGLYDPIEALEQQLEN